jgi:hypothetical protein
MTNQYINNSNSNYFTEEQQRQQEQPKGLNKTGVLLLKNIQDKIEYHLYNNKLPYPVCMESFDINESLRLHTYSVLKSPIHISITCDNKTVLEGTGALKSKIDKNGVEKFYLWEVDGESVGDKAEKVTDIEEILFNNTNTITNIKINTIHKEEVIVDEKGNTVNESREN